VFAQGSRQKKYKRKNKHNMGKRGKNGWQRNEQKSIKSINPWLGEDKRMAEALDKPERSGEMTLESLLNYKKFLRTEWPRRRAKVLAVWESMSEKTRTDLVRTISPTTPASPNEDKTSLPCVLLPHLCLSNLVPGNRFIEMLDERSNPEVDDQDLNYADYDFVKELIVSQKLKGNLTRLEKEFTFMVPDERFGQSMEILVPTADINSWFEREIIINKSVFGNLFHYQFFTYFTLCGMLEEICTEMLDKKNKLVAKISGCGKCGKSNWREDSEKQLKYCPCRNIAYCSRECQTAHWPEHKIDHPKS